MDMLHSRISSIITGFGILHTLTTCMAIYQNFQNKYTLWKEKASQQISRNIFQCHANNALTGSSNEMEKETSRKIISTPFLGAVKSTFPSLCLMLKLVGRSFRITVCPSS